MSEKSSRAQFGLKKKILQNLLEMIRKWFSSIFREASASDGTLELTFRNSAPQIDGKSFSRHSEKVFQENFFFIPSRPAHHVYL